MQISKGKSCFKVKSSTSYFPMKTKILADFEICINIPLKSIFVLVNGIVFNASNGLIVYLFHDGGGYEIETNPLICVAIQWTGFYIITASVMKELTPCLMQLLHKVF